MSKFYVFNVPGRKDTNFKSNFNEKEKNHLHINHTLRRGVYSNGDIRL